MSVILGINAFHAGASAAVLIDGQPVAAIAEERLNRKKYYAHFPTLAIQKCLDMAGVTLADIDAVALGRDARANLNKKAEYLIKNPSRLLNLLRIRSSRSELDDLKAYFASTYKVDSSKMKFKQFNVEHHVAHIASGYFISGWDKAAGFSIDGSGDFVTCMLADCEGDDIRIKRRVYVPHSLGAVYSMISQLIGYNSYGDEGKVMGLAPYGEDSYHDVFEDMVSCTNDGFTLNSKFFLPFGANQGLSIDDDGAMVVERQYSDETVRLLGKPRNPQDDLTRRDMDLAFGVQRLFERVYLHVLNLLHEIVPVDRVAMAGGCTLNSVVNGKIFDETPFRQTCIQPAAGDEGLALGSALYVSRSILGDRNRYVMEHSYLGPEFSDGEIKVALDAAGVRYDRLDQEALVEETSKEIVRGQVIGWFQGRMEWGPRALGNRSILVHPGLPDMKSTLNERIKRREWYRPFAPVVLAERQGDIFEQTHPSPFMLHVYKIKPEWREKLCAVNHVDNTGRLQTVSHRENPLYYDLIKKFDEMTGIPVLLNTSFNENEPIVCTPVEAIDCFLRTRMDVLVVGSYLCRKSENARG